MRMLLRTNPARQTEWIQTSSLYFVLIALAARIFFTAEAYSAPFSDANWTSMGNPAGVDGPVFAMVVDGSGNLYIGGGFTVAGDVPATNIAKWNGSNWSALGSGMNSVVRTLAVSGSDLYAGGRFTTAGGGQVNFIARWNGSNWSALGSGMNDEVRALAVSGNNVYAGGVFTTAGGSAANAVIKWDGSN